MAFTKQREDMLREYMTLLESVKAQQIGVQMLQAEAKGVLQQMESLEHFLFAEMRTDSKIATCQKKIAILADVSVVKNRYLSSLRS